MRLLLRSRKSLGLLALPGVTFFALGTALVIAQVAGSTIRMEAEQGTLSGQVASATDAQASGGAFVNFLSGVSQSEWAFEETFNGAPASPSQSLLPKTFDYVVTHRNHTSTPNGPWASYPVDHGHDCSPPPTQRNVTTTHDSDSTNPDQSFFICRDHMMSSMGDVEGYSVTTFMPKQEFDFASGNGVIEFDVNINSNAGRSWIEVLLSPRDEMHYGAAEDWLPIDETYPEKRIVLTYSPWEQVREMKVGSGAIAPSGWTARATEAGWGWRNKYPNDPANSSRTVRRKNRVIINNNRITWQIQKQDGSFDDFVLNVPGGLPFSRGIVMFKTHAYTPTKDGNMNLYTYHWDNIRFNGPRLAPYRNVEVGGVVNLAANGNKPIGSTQTQTVNIDSIGNNPVLVGQVHNGQRGQSLVSINGNTNIDVTRGTIINCTAGGWSTFYVPIDRSLLRQGANTFRWTVGPRNQCMESWQWDGFSIKSLEVQFDN